MKITVKQLKTLIREAITESTWISTVDYCHDDPDTFCDVPGTAGYVGGMKDRGESGSPLLDALEDGLNASDGKIDRACVNLVLTTWDQEYVSKSENPKAEFAGAYKLVQWLRKNVGKQVKKSGTHWASW